MAFDRQVQTLRQRLHHAAWAVHDDFRLLRRVVEVERRLYNSLFVIPAPPVAQEVPELVELLLLTESLMDQQSRAFGNVTQEN